MKSGNWLFLECFAGAGGKALAEPGDARAAEVERAVFAGGIFRKDEGQADAQHFERAGLVARNETEADELVWRQQRGIGEPAVGRVFVHLVQHGEVIARSNIFRRKGSR